MRLRNSDASYGLITKGLHWLMALTIIGMLVVGFYMDSMAVSPEKFKLYGIHKAVGIMVLSFALLRWLWRQLNPVPKLPEDLPVWQKLAAHAGHLALYLLMIVMPLTGWLMSSAAGFPVSVFGLFTLPDLIEPDKELVEQLKLAHEILAFVIIANVSVHVLAAFYHHFIHKDMILKRMLPW